MKIIIKFFFKKMPPLDSIWTYYNKLGHVPGFQQKRAECKQCKTQINFSLRQAQAHFRKCAQITTEQRQKYFGELYQETSDSIIISNIKTPFNSNNTSTKQITNYFKVDTITSAEQKALELTFARSIFRCGLFLSLSEMEPIKELWKQARPAFKLPSRKKLSTKLLDIVYEETKTEIESLLNNCENLCLISDGWYNSFLFYYLLKFNKLLNKYI